MVVRNGSHGEREVITSAGAVSGEGPARERPPGRSRDRGADAVRLGDPAGVVPQSPEDHRGAAAALPGLAAIMGAKVVGAGTIIAADLSDLALECAKSLSRLQDR